MSAQAHSLDAIERFLALKRFAMVGISRDPKDFSMSLFQELCRRGYDVVPVNPKTPNVMGKICYARMQDIRPPVEGALLMTSPAHTEAVVADCAAAGIRKIWMYRAAGSGAVSTKALEFCREHGMEVIPGECPFMFLPHAGGVHRLHGFFRKITGRLPKRTKE